MAPWLLLGVESNRDAGGVLRGGRGGELWPCQDGHFGPAARTTHGIDASMITSDGTCRLVMPRAESTMARGGRLS